MARRIILAVLALCLLAVTSPSCRASARRSSRSYRSRILVSGPRLETFLGLERRLYPGAAVVGRFYDWRTASQYRESAGLHLGYDVALPPGSPVMAAWPGQVTRIQPWYQDEYGITVRSPSGYETTYGHLAPKVRVGAAIAVGQVVGTTRIDHVDIKMRGPSGAWFDFGAGLAGLDEPVPGPSPGVVPAATKDTLLKAYVAAVYERAHARIEVNRAKERVKSAKRALLSARSSVEQAKQRQPQLEQYYQEGLIARRELDDARARIQAASVRLHELEDDVKLARGQLQIYQVRVGQAQADLDMLRATLIALGMTDAQIQVAVAHLLKQGKMTEAVQLRRLQARERSERHTRSHRQQVDAEKARADYERLQGLYEQGAVSRAEVEAARRRLDKLTAPAAEKIRLNPRPLPPPPPEVPPSPAASPAPGASPSPGASPAPGVSPAAPAPAKENPRGEKN